MHCGERRARTAGLRERRLSLGWLRGLQHRRATRASVVELDRSNGLPAPREVAIAAVSW